MKMNNHQDRFTQRMMTLSAVVGKERKPCWFVRLCRKLRLLRERYSRGQKLIIAIAEQTIMEIADLPDEDKAKLNEIFERNRKNNRK